ncbi:MAG: hypothetical protein WC703_03020 [Candidatus Neomarinimicrobiota bacterium]
MKNWMVVAIVAGLVALILGIITHFVPGDVIIITAKGWNSLAQTLLLLAIAYGLLKSGGK